MNTTPSRKRTAMSAPCSRAALLAAALVALAAPTTSFAGVKYWDNQAFKAYDADAYVQGGLVLNYDGIRNQGLDADHSTNATTWVNLANPGTQNLTRSSAGAGYWLDDGFYFDGKTTFGNSGLTVAGPYYTTEALVNAACASQNTLGQIGYIMFVAGDSNKNWTRWSLAVRKTADDSGGGLWFNTHDYTINRPKIYNSSGTFDYVTAVANGTYTAVFSGLDEPTGAIGRYDVKSGVSQIGTFTSDEWTLGGTGSQILVGTIRSFRHYSRYLSLEERTWNRAIDDYRFFGTQFSTIPVTNAVIASAVTGLSILDVPANEPSGCYAVDADGYTFTAPATTNVNGRAYTCTGYTLETWDDATGDWGDPVSHSGSLSCAATCTSRIRITWQWTAGDGIVTRYDVGDYVQDGLILHYDGIRNAGADQPHSDAPSSWANLAPAGGHDLNFHAKTGVTMPGEWRADGYRFEQQSWFSPDAAFTIPSNQTMQIAIEANALDQEAYRNNSNTAVNEPYLYYNSGTFNKGGSISLRRDTTATGVEWFDWSTHGYGTGTGEAATRPNPTQPNGTPLRYVTAVLADDYSAAFLGTSIPTTTSTTRKVDSGVKMAIETTPQEQNAASPGFFIGGLRGNTLQKFKGTIHNFRLYNRVLTDEELATNRMIDDYRFHGVIPVTNAVVATSHTGLEGAERSGPYEISGSHAFTAPATATDARGIEYACTGYTLETWDSSLGAWGEPVSHGGSLSCTATDAALVRITWQWQASGALFTAADYDVSDYVAGGLVLHYDGLQNIGVESAESTNPTSAWSRVWANIAPAGGYDATYKSTVGTQGSWSGGGFTFASASNFKYDGAFTFSPKSTHQTLVEGVGDSTANGGSLSGSGFPRGYVMFGSADANGGSVWNRAGSFSFVCDTSHTWIDLAAHGFAGATSETRCDPCLTLGTNLTYATGIMGDGYMAAFYGTEIPSATTTRWRNPSRLSTSGLTLGPATSTAIYLGAANGGQPFIGTVKNYRYYDRALTNEELRRNRQVDSARYFGALAFTNVVVAVGDGLTVTATPAAGAYAVEGAYTFSAAAGADTPNGYKLEEWDASAGAWTNLGFFESLSYTYDAATSPAKVRLTWRKTNPFVMVVR